jgi:hypothetical protein
MDQKFMFQDVSPAELRMVEGGFLKSLVNGIKAVAGAVGDAISTVADYAWGAFTDMAGGAAAIFGLGWRW